MNDDLVHGPEDALLEEAFEAFPELQAPPDLMAELLQLTEETLAGEAACTRASAARACAEPSSAEPSAAAGDVEAPASSRVSWHRAPLEAGSSTGMPAGLAEILRILVTEPGGRRFLLKTAALSVTVGLSFGATFGTCVRLPEEPSATSTSEEQMLPNPKHR